MLLRIFVSPESRKIYISITTHYNFIVWIEHHSIFSSTLEIPPYPLHTSIILCLDVISKPGTLINSKGNIWSCV